jgi:hypothetical protein
VPARIVSGGSKGGLGDNRNPQSEDRGKAAQADAARGDVESLQKDAAYMGRAGSKEEVAAAKEATVFANSLVGADHEAEVFDGMPLEGVGEDVGAAGVVSGAPREWPSLSTPARAQ